jgi:hypothetical protein
MAQKFTNIEIRKWALVMAALFTLVGLVQYLVWSHHRAALILWIIAAIFLLPGLLVPAALKPGYAVWLKIAAGLAWFNTRLILGLTFYLVFTPLGLIMRLFGKDLISEKWDPQAKSYWIEREAVPFDRERYEKQY